MLPALRALREAQPHAYLAVAAARGIGELVTAGSLADAIIDLGIIRTTEANAGGTVKRVAQLLGKGRRDYDWILDFSPRWETQVAAFLKWRGRHVTPPKISQLLDFFLKRGQAPADDHAAECASVLKQVGVKNFNARLVVPVASEESLRFEKLLSTKRAAEGAPVVVLYSSYAGEEDGWRLEQFAELAERLANNFAARLVVVDEPADSRFTKALKPRLPAGAILLAAPRAVELAAAVERASLVISDERGIAKLAMDADAPVIEIADAPSPYAQTPAYRLLRASSRPRVEVESVYETACEMLQGSRTASLIGR